MPRHRFALAVGLASALLAGACGVEPKPSRVELFVVSGFCPASSGHAFDDPCYLRSDAGPEIAAALRGASHEVLEHEYGDTESDYSRFLEDLRRAGRERATQPTKVVFVGHSHGCVWTHAVTRAEPDVRVDLLVDLDATSYGWLLRSTASIGDPRDACTAPDGKTKVDLQDFVFGNVAENLEVRSGEHAVYGLAPELYDEQANVAVSPSSRITTWDVRTSHSEVHAKGGATLRRVIDWVVARAN